jgi:hypothetical protein
VFSNGISAVIAGEVAFLAGSLREQSKTDKASGASRAPTIDCETRREETFLGPA